MKTCKTCENWIDATADCSVQLKCQCNGWDVPASVDRAMAKDANAANDCEDYRGND